MSGTAVIIIVVLAVLVVAGGSILVLGLNRQERHTPLDVHHGNNSGDPPTAGNQQSGSQKN